jgi:uridine kinase
MEFPEAQYAIKRIVELSRIKSPIVVAADGRSGSGKSTLCHWIAGQVDGIVIDQDDFYAGGEISAWQRLTPQEKADRVIDWQRVREEVLQPLLAGNQATWHPSDWNSMEGLAPESTAASPSKIVILDGAYSSRVELCDLIDLSILVVLPDAVRRERLKQREGEAFVSEWHAVWDEAEDYYFGHVRPPQAFDVVIERPVDP